MRRAKQVSPTREIEHMSSAAPCPVYTLLDVMTHDCAYAATGNGLASLWLFSHVPVLFTATSTCRPDGYQARGYERNLVGEMLMLPRSATAARERNLAAVNKPVLEDVNSTLRYGAHFGSVTSLALPPRRGLSSEPSMDVGALGRPLGAPRGRQIAPDGSPGPPKCEVQWLSEQPTFLRTESRLATPERALLRRDRLCL